MASQPIHLHRNPRRSAYEASKLAKRLRRQVGEAIADFGMIGGLPKGGKTTFNPKQEGTYTVNPDCTGTMKIVYLPGGAVPAGVETDLNIVVAADGTLVESVVYRAVTVSGESFDHTMCPPHCEQGVQESFEGKKVLVYGFR